METNAGNSLINGTSSVSHQDDNSHLFFNFAAIRPTRTLLMEANAESLAQT